MSAGSAIKTHCCKKIWTRDGSCEDSKAQVSEPVGQAVQSGAAAGGGGLTAPAFWPQTENRSHVLGRVCTALKRAYVCPKKGRPRWRGAVSTRLRHQRMRRYRKALRQQPVGRLGQHREFQRPILQSSANPNAGFHLAALKQQFQMWVGSALLAPMFLTPLNDRDEYDRRHSGSNLQPELANRGDWIHSALTRDSRRDVLTQDKTTPDEPKWWAPQDTAKRLSVVISACFPAGSLGSLGGWARDRLHCSPTSDYDDLLITWSKSSRRAASLSKLEKYYSLDRPQKKRIYIKVLSSRSERSASHPPCRAVSPCASVEPLRSTPARDHMTAPPGAPSGRHQRTTPCKHTQRKPARHRITRR